MLTRSAVLKAGDLPTYSAQQIKENTENFNSNKQHVGDTCLGDIIALDYCYSAKADKSWRDDMIRRDAKERLRRLIPRAQENFSEILVAAGCLLDSMGRYDWFKSDVVTCIQCTYLNEQSSTSRLCETSAWTTR